MRITRILVLLAISYTLVGCATKSLDMSVTDKEVFYEPPKDKALASLYLTCGKMAKDGHYEDSFIENNGSCDFAINGKKYSQISIGQVGRVDIAAGKFTLSNSRGEEEDLAKYYFLSTVKTLDIKPSEKILFVSDRNFKSVPAYAMWGGLLGALVMSIADAIDPPPKQIMFPLIIYKNDFMNQISMKTPVKVFVIDDK